MDLTCWMLVCDGHIQYLALHIHWGEAMESAEAQQSEPNAGATAWCSTSVWPLLFPPWAINYLRQLKNIEQDLDRALSLLVLQPVLLVCLLHTSHLSGVNLLVLCCVENFALTRREHGWSSWRWNPWRRCGQGSCFKQADSCLSSPVATCHQSTCATLGTSPQLMSCVLLTLSPCKCSCQLFLLVFEIAWCCIMMLWWSL